MAGTALTTKAERDAPCHCGSGKRYKKCCIGKSPEQQARAFMQHATSLMAKGDTEAGLETGRRTCELFPDNAEAHGYLSFCLERLNRIDEALPEADKALELDPKNAVILVVKSSILRRMRKFDESLAVAETAIKATAEPYQLAEAWNERGHALDRLGRYGEAFDAFTTSGKHLAQSPHAQQVRRVPWAQYLDAFREGCDAELLKQWGAEQYDKAPFQPVFLFGFPRSGTTMLEQLLGAHEKIVTTGEKPVLDHGPREVYALCEGNADPRALKTFLTREKIIARRQKYWADAEKVIRRDCRGMVVIDKQPMQVLEVGLINILFPEAKLLMAIRDPRDVCLSCFMQFFHLNLATINFLSIEQTANFYSLAMQFWLDFRDRLTVPRLDIDYRDTVDNLEAQTRRILEFLDLEWDPAMLSFHETMRGRLVSTPSYSAVTTAVHKQALERWRNYESQLAPVMPALEPFVREFGYE